MSSKEKLEKDYENFNMNIERMSEEEIKNYCRKRIANYKAPKYIKFVHDIPLAGVGKIQKFKLPEEAKEELQRRKLGS